MEQAISQLPIEQLRQIRIDKLNKLRELGIDPFPAKSNRTNVISDIINKYEEFEGKQVILAGRVMSWRGHGSVSFGDLKDVSGQIQLYIHSDDLSKTEKESQSIGYEDLNLIDIGDIVEVKGTITKTQRGQISISPSILRILAKSLRPLPDKHVGIKDKEERFRRRYLDILMNDDVREMFERKSKFWKVTREFLNQNGFIEVETPVLEHVTGGADANPFVTHHDALDEDFYLRISTELYQKRLIGAGFEKIFTLAPNFRNEGIDDEHLQEYYQVEWYWAYANYKDNMEFTKNMFRYVANEVYGKTDFVKGEHKFDLADEWKEVDYVKVMKERFNIDIFNSTYEEVLKIAKENKIKLDGDINRQRLIDNLWKIIRKEISGPAFLINEPKFMSPLAKSKTEDPNLTERYHVIIAGSELANGYSELNDPIDQLERFREQQNARDSGDDEAQMLDIDYVEMLEWGMPPVSGHGHSERVFWFFENVSAREGTLFPQMKRQLAESTKKIYGIKDNPKASNQKATKASGSYEIDEAIKSDFPGISFAYVTISGVDIKKSNKDLEEFKKLVVDKSSKILMDEISNIGSLVSYRDLFKKSGTDFHSKRPSPEALLRRVIQGKGIYNINTAVDAYNLAVLGSHIGLGGFDFDQISEPIVLRYSKAGEQMVLLGDDAPTILRDGQVIYIDAKGPITMDLNYRDIDRTKITEKTKNVILFADGGVGISEEDIMSALKKGAEYIQKYCGGEVGEYNLVN